MHHLFLNSSNWFAAFYSEYFPTLSSIAFMMLMGVALGLIGGSVGLLFHKKDYKFNKGWALIRSFIPLFFYGFDVKSGKQKWRFNLYHAPDPFKDLLSSVVSATIVLLLTIGLGFQGFLPLILPLFSAFTGAVFLKRILKIDLLGAFLPEHSYPPIEELLKTQMQKIEGAADFNQSDVDEVIDKDVNDPESYLARISKAVEQASKNDSK